jgi:hypothetical protein
MTQSRIHSDLGGVMRRYEQCGSGSQTFPDSFDVRTTSRSVRLPIHFLNGIFGCENTLNKRDIVFHS